MTERVRREEPPGAPPGLALPNASPNPGPTPRTHLALPTRPRQPGHDPLAQQPAATACPHLSTATGHAQASPGPAWPRPGPSPLARATLARATWPAQPGPAHRGPAQRPTAHASLDLPPVAPPTGPSQPGPVPPLGSDTLALPHCALAAHLAARANIVQRAIPGLAPGTPPTCTAHTGTPAPLALPTGLCQLALTDHLQLPTGPPTCLPDRGTTLTPGTPAHLAPPTGLVPPDICDHLASEPPGPRPPGAVTTWLAHTSPATGPSHRPPPLASPAPLALPTWPARPGGNQPPSLPTGTRSMLTSPQPSHCPHGPRHKQALAHLSMPTWPRPDCSARSNMHWPYYNANLARQLALPTGPRPTSKSPATAH
eukprot:gene28588-31756_t